MAHARNIRPIDRPARTASVRAVSVGTIRTASARIALAGTAPFRTAKTAPDRIASFRIVGIISFKTASFRTYRTASVGIITFRAASVRTSRIAPVGTAPASFRTSAVGAASAPCADGTARYTTASCTAGNILGVNGYGHHYGRPFDIANSSSCHSELVQVARRGNLG
jgi:hypothetical protein